MSVFLLTVRTALRSLRRNPLRTLLTMLGVVIGVASVITMLAMAAGATREMQDRIAGLGSNVLMIWAESPRHGGVSQGNAMPIHLTPEDALAIGRECGAVRAASGMDHSNGQCVYQDRNWATSIVGTGPDYPAVRNLEMAAGTWFSENDVRSEARVCVLGATVARQLFGSLDPLNALIRVKGQPFKVIGVTRAKGDSGMGGDQDDRVFGPVSTVMRRIDHQAWLDYVMLSAREGRVEPAMRQIRALLRQRHRLSDDAPDDFSIRTQTEIAQQASAQGQIMTMFLGGVAAVSLLVGGIGIMNIMLVTVTERIREIGIRLAVGARGQDIMLQFLAESVVLSCASGLLGIGIGLVAARIAATMSEWPFYVTGQSIAMAFGFSIFVGIFFGFYPAVKASRLDPIEALRTE